MMAAASAGKLRSAEQVTPAILHHGEGPFWDWRDNRLLCVDMLEGTVVALGSGEIHRFAVPDTVATVIRHRAQGGFIIGTEHGVLAADERFSNFTNLAHLTDDPGLRTNDGGCDPLGALIIGTMSYDGIPNRGTVYRLTPDHHVLPVLAPVSISNGVQWSADGSLVYYIDTPRRKVDVFNVDQHSGAWLRRRTHINLEHTEGFPDGMAIDDEDGLWIAFWGGGMVRHYNNKGQLVEAILIPGVSQVSSCAFGGDDRSVLYVTTSRQGLREGKEPNAGAIFALQTESVGAPLLAFAG